MTRKTLLSAAAAFLLGNQMLWAQISVEKPLPVDGHIAPNGSLVELNWFAATPPRVGAVTVKRRRYGQTGGASWETVSSLLGPAMRFTDETVRAGVAYEYKVLRSARDIVDAGYWLTGVELPAKDVRGNAYVVVDETLAEEIAPRLARFERDLIGDGWRVLRRTAPRWDNTVSIATLEAAQSIKNWLREQYLADPFGKHAVVLVGRVPIVTSGGANPDGHKVEPHATDLFYVEMDGQWRANSEGFLLENQLPSDFIEMQIGRIDFASITGTDRDLEIHLLQSYFDKNHHWRMGLIGDLRAAYGASSHLQTEQYSLQNIVGPRSVKTGELRDSEKLPPWLWGVDFGTEQYANSAVFAINFGSGKQKINAPANEMVTLLAQPWYPIAVGWGGRPAWWLHHMALGGTIGDVHIRTVNNGIAKEAYRESMDYYPTGYYLWRNPIWVNLVGDPTARAFPLEPPSQVVAAKTDQGVALSWAASKDPDVIQYKIYRAPEDSMTFTPLDESTAVQGIEFIDRSPEQNTRYMVRAYGLKDVYAGSFYTLSQGAFADVEAQTSFATELEMTSAAGVDAILPEVFDTVQDGKIYALIEGPKIGQLRHDGAHWRYTPPTGFRGKVRLRFSVSDGLQTRKGILTITVED